MHTRREVPCANIRLPYLRSGTYTENEDTGGNFDLAELGGSLVTGLGGTQALPVAVAQRDPHPSGSSMTELPTRTSQHTCRARGRLPWSTPEPSG